jgi:hypothetical protein
MSNTTDALKALFPIVACCAIVGFAVHAYDSDEENLRHPPVFDSPETSTIDTQVAKASEVAKSMETEARPAQPLGDLQIESMKWQADDGYVQATAVIVNRGSVAHHNGFLSCRATTTAGLIVGTTDNMLTELAPGEAQSVSPMASLTAAPDHFTCKIKIEE